MAGDLNAHIGEESELIENDIDADTNFISMHTNDDIFDHVTDCVTVLEKLNIPIKRKSQDKSRINNFGHALIDFCKSLSLIILNGRVGEDKYYGKITNTRAKTTVDYCLSDPDFLAHVSSFKVHDFDPSISDLHCRLSLSIELCGSEAQPPNVNDSYDYPPTGNTGSDDSNTTIKWCKNCHPFSRNDILFDNEDILQLERTCDSDVDVDTIYNTIKDNLVKACTACGLAKIIKPRKIPYKPMKLNGTGKKGKVWYNDSCQQAKSNYVKARKLHAQHKKIFESNRDQSGNLEQELKLLEDDVKTKSNKYKSTIRKAKKMHRK